MHVRSPHTAVITAARADEQSSATEYSDGIWHADEFSFALSRLLPEGSLTVRDLWKRIAAKTRSSHVQLGVSGIDPGAVRVGMKT